MTRDELIEQLMRFPNSPVIYQLDLEEPNMKARPPIYHIAYEEKTDRILLCPY